MLRTLAAPVGQVFEVERRVLGSWIPGVGSRFCCCFRKLRAGITKFSLRSEEWLICDLSTFFFRFIEFDAGDLAFPSQLVFETQLWQQRRGVCDHQSRAIVSVSLRLQPAAVYVSAGYNTEAMHQMIQQVQKTLSILLPTHLGFYQTIAVTTDCKEEVERTKMIRQLEEARDRYQLWLDAALLLSPLEAQAEALPNSNYYYQGQGDHSNSYSPSLPPPQAWTSPAAISSNHIVVVSPQQGFAPTPVLLPHPYSPSSFPLSPSSEPPLLPPLPCVLGEVELAPVLTAPQQPPLQAQNEIGGGGGEGVGDYGRLPEVVGET